MPHNRQVCQVSRDDAYTFYDPSIDTLFVPSAHLPYTPKTFAFQNAILWYPGHVIELLRHKYGDGLAVARVLLLWQLAESDWDIWQSKLETVVEDNVRRWEFEERKWWMDRLGTAKLRVQEDGVACYMDWGDEGWEACWEKLVRDTLVWEGWRRREDEVVVDARPVDDGGDEKEAVVVALRMSRERCSGPNARWNQRIEQTTVGGFAGGGVMRPERSDPFTAAVMERPVRFQVAEGLQKAAGEEGRKRTTERADGVHETPSLKPSVHEVLRHQTTIPGHSPPTIKAVQRPLHNPLTTPRPRNLAKDDLYTLSTDPSLTAQLTLFVSGSYLPYISRHDLQETIKAFYQLHFDVLSPGPERQLGTPSPRASFRRAIFNPDPRPLPPPLNYSMARTVVLEAVRQSNISTRAFAMTHLERVVDKALVSEIEARILETALPQRGDREGLRVARRTRDRESGLGARWGREISERTVGGFAGGGLLRRARSDPYLSMVLEGEVKVQVPVALRKAAEAESRAARLRAEEGKRGGVVGRDDGSSPELRRMSTIDSSAYTIDMTDEDWGLSLNEPGRDHPATHPSAMARLPKPSYDDTYSANSDSSITASFAALLASPRLPYIRKSLLCDEASARYPGVVFKPLPYVARFNTPFDKFEIEPHVYYDILPHLKPNPARAIFTTVQRKVNSEKRWAMMVQAGRAGASGKDAVMTMLQDPTTMIPGQQLDEEGSFPLRTSNERCSGNNARWEGRIGPDTVGGFAGGGVPRPGRSDPLAPYAFKKQSRIVVPAAMRKAAEEHRQMTKHQQRSDEGEEGTKKAATVLTRPQRRRQRKNRTSSYADTKENRVAWMDGRHKKWPSIPVEIMDEEDEEFIPQYYGGMSQWRDSNWETESESEGSAPSPRPSNDDGAYEFVEPGDRGLLNPGSLTADDVAGFGIEKTEWEKKFAPLEAPSPNSPAAVNKPAAPHSPATISYGPGPTPPHLPQASSDSEAAEIDDWPQADHKYTHLGPGRGKATRHLAAVNQLGFAGGGVTRRRASDVLPPLPNPARVVKVPGGLVEAAAGSRSAKRQLEEQEEDAATTGFAEADVAEHQRQREAEVYEPLPDASVYDKQQCITSHRKRTDRSIDRLALEISRKSRRRDSGRAARWERRMSATTVGGFAGGGVPRPRRDEVRIGERQGERRFEVPEGLVRAAKLASRGIGDENRGVEDERRLSVCSPLPRRRRRRTADGRRRDSESSSEHGEKTEREQLAMDIPNPTSRQRISVPGGLVWVISSSEGSTRDSSTRSSSRISDSASKDEPAVPQFAFEPDEGPSIASSQAMIKRGGMSTYEMFLTLALVILASLYTWERWDRYSIS